MKALKILQTAYPWKFKHMGGIFQVQLKSVKDLEALASLGNEFKILLDTSLEDISTAAGEDIAEAVNKMRTGNLYIKPGYDGEFGVVSLDKKPKRPKKPKAKKKGMLF